MKLIASSASLEGIASIVRSYFYSPNLKLSHNGEFYDIVKSDGSKSKAFRVTQKGKRFRLEQI